MYLLLATLLNPTRPTGVFWDPKQSWGLLGPQWAGAYYFNVLLMHTLERKLSKMPGNEYSFKLTEIWLIDEDIKGKSLNPNFLASGKIAMGPKRPHCAHFYTNIIRYKLFICLIFKSIILCIRPKHHLFQFKDLTYPIIFICKYDDWCDRAMLVDTLSSQ